MKRSLLILAILCLALLILSESSQAQGGYNLAWWTVDGGGGGSDGGGYTLVGTIGQPDVGVLMSGGDYTLAGGLWGVGVAGGGSGDNRIYLPIVIRGS